MRCCTDDGKISRTTMLLRCFLVLNILVVVKGLIDVNTTEKGKINTNTTRTTTTRSTTKIMATETEYISAVNGITTLQDMTKFLQVYQVVTCDGYILDIFRLRAYNQTKKQPNLPVLMFHGMLQSSDRFIGKGLEYGVAFRLYCLGFDVWLGNNRGNKYGRLHLHLDPDLYDDRFKFFNYTYEEIGRYDLAAIVDYILEETNNTQLHYIGHSQGATAYMVLNSLLPRYNIKFATAHLIAPLGYQENFPNTRLQKLTTGSEGVYQMLLEMGIVEVFQYNSTYDSPYESEDYCLGDKKYSVICKELNFTAIMALDSEKFKHFDTSGGSIKQLIHYAQNINSKMFRRYDYGSENNKLKYGTNEPPKYNLSAVTADTTLYYSLEDDLVEPKDVLAMAGDMPNGRVWEVCRNTFKHSDFIDAPDAVECVYNYIVNDMMRWANPGDSSNNLRLSSILYIIPFFSLIMSLDYIY